MALNVSPCSDPMHLHHWFYTKNSMSLSNILALHTDPYMYALWCHSVDSVEFNPQIKPVLTPMCKLKVQNTALN